MMQKRPLLFLLIISLCILLSMIALGGLSGFSLLSLVPRPQPASDSQSIFKGILYHREARESPRPMVIHVITVDLRASGISLLVTPGDPKADLPLKALKTTEFLDQFGVQLAINGSGFTPWHSNSMLDYYPHSGDPVKPIGFAASKGTTYSKDSEDQPVLYFSRTNQARFGSPPGKTYNAIAGNLMIVKDGRSLPDLGTETEPRTAIGLDKRGKTLVIVVVDGRQPGYSEGATLDDLASILVKNGAYTAMNLDGGGSSTLVIEKGGKPVVLNSPINNGVPGTERPVGNHLGIFAEPADK